jgi:translocation and assembly module TamB
MNLKKIARITFIVFPLALLLLIAAAFAVVRSQAFQRFVLSTIIEKTQAQTGARVEIRNIALHWSPFAIDLFGIVLHGQEQNREPALFGADHLRVGLAIRDLLHHQINLSEIALDRPVVHLRVDPAGNSNLPRPPTRSTSSSNFRLLVRQLAIRNGLVSYNDEQIPLSAELDNFAAEAGWDATTSTYKGSLGYTQGRVLTKRMNPFKHTAHVDFEAKQDELELRRIDLRSGGSHLTVQAKVSDFANPSVDGRYDGVVLPAEVAFLLKASPAPSGEITLSGTLGYRHLPNQAALKSVTVRGRMDSEKLGLPLNERRVAVDSIHASYHLQGGNFRLQKLDADALGGHFTSDAEALHLPDKPVFHLNASVHGASLEALTNMVPIDAREKVRLVGTADVQAKAVWADDIQRIRGHSRVEIHGPATVDSTSGAIPVNGLLDVSYDGRTPSASFGQSQIRTGSTTVSLTGTLSQNSSLNIVVKADDLHELGSLASGVVSSYNSNTPSLATTYDIHGKAQFSGQLSGSVTDPRIRGHLSATDLRAQGGSWPVVRANLDVSPPGAELRDGYLQQEQQGQQGQLSFNGRIGLQHWSIASNKPFSAYVKLANLSVDKLQQLAKMDYPASGELSGEIWVEGSPSHPLGHGSLQLVRASIYGEPVKSVRLNLTGGKDSLTANGQLVGSAGAIDTALTYFPEAERYQINVNTASLDLARIQTLQQRAGSASGLLTATIKGQGTISEPQLDSEVQIPDLQVNGQRFEKTQAQLSMARQHAEFSLKSVVADGYVQANGGVDLNGQYLSNVSMDVRSLPLGPLLAKYVPKQGQDLQGALELHGTLNGPLKDPDQVQARVEIPTLNLKYKEIQIANDRPLRIKFSNGMLAVEEARIKGTGSELNLQGSIPVKSAAPLNVSAKGTVDLTLLQLLSADLHTSGQIQIDVKAAGTPSRPTTQGSIRLVNTSLAAEALPLALSGINADMSVSENRIDLRELRGTAGGGPLSGHGSFLLGPQPTFNLDLEAKSVRVHQTGIRSTVEAKLQLSGNTQKSLVTGQVLVHRLSFQEGFDLSSFVSQFSGGPNVSTTSTFENNMRLNVAVQSTDNLNLASSQLSIEGNADLRVTGTAGNPVILGRVALTGGEVFFSNKRFEIQSGTIVFANPVRTEPVVNLYVNTKVEQYNITINFVGPLDQLKTTYTSDPSLPPLDIINLLAFGQTTAEKASTGSTPASVGAESALAQGVAGQVGKGLQNLTGISQLTIDPMAGSTQNPGAQVSVQQRVTGSTLLTFSTDVTSTQTQTVQLEYQPKKQVTISLVRDQFGGYGFDVRLHKVF